MHKINTVGAKNNINYSKHTLGYVSKCTAKHAKSLICRFKRKGKTFRRLDVNIKTLRAFKNCTKKLVFNFSVSFSLNFLNSSCTSRYPLQLSNSFLSAGLCIGTVKA